MLKGYDENGELKNVLVTENGAVKVAMEGGQGETEQVEIVNTAENAVPVNMQNQSINIGNTSQNAIPVDIQNQSIIVGNTSQNAIPVNVTNTEEVETTLNASVQTVGTTASTISVNKKITTIDIANYSETADITVTIGNLVAVIGCSIATTLTINANVSNVSLISTEADTKVQIVIKGVN